MADMQKVTYKTVAILKDGSLGNVQQTAGVFYTELPISKIEDSAKEYFAPKKLHPIIVKIELVKGFILNP